MDAFWGHLATLWSYGVIRAAIVVAGSIAAAFLGEALFRRTIVVLAGKTKTDLDDLVVTAIRRPIFVSIICIGLSYATETLAIKDSVAYLIYAVLKSLAVVVWTIASMRLGSEVFRSLSRKPGVNLVQPRTLPVFEMMVKIVGVGAGMYFVFLAWKINVTGWLASAGVLGIVLGLAAKDSLANLFAGIFILADAPYKVGDFIMLDDMRGRVTMIGIRSTRILTRDDIEITIPNALLGNSKIINETGGPETKARVPVSVDVAYGSDIDLVREVLLTCGGDVEHVCHQPTPRVRFQAMGESGLRFSLMVWIDDPYYRDEVVDLVNTQIYKALAKHKIEIPYNKLDVFVKQMVDKQWHAPAELPIDVDVDNTPS